MKRVLLTGMSGTGKSTLIVALSARGYKAIDTDELGWCKSGPDGGLLWREDRMRVLLATEDAEILFVSGCSENQVGFYPQFAHIFFLSAPASTLVPRLLSRPNNPHGKHSSELAAVLEYLQTVEPRLRQRASLEIDASAPFDEVLTEVLRLVSTQKEIM